MLIYWVGPNDQQVFYDHPHLTKAEILDQAEDAGELYSDSDQLAN